MKKKGSNYTLRFLAIILALCAITLYLPVAIISVSADSPGGEEEASAQTEDTYSQGSLQEFETEANSDTQTRSEECETEYVDPEEYESESGMNVIGGMVEIPFQDEHIADVQGNDQFSQYIPNDDGGTYIIADGIYSFENLGNSGLFMDIQQDKYLPGYHMQQYAANGNPAQTFDRSCLFKITRVAASGTYIIRSMLNNRLTFYFSGTEVLTKEISPDDSEVSVNDTFYLTYSEYYKAVVIKPYGSNNIVAANNTTASGMAGAPNSYLKKSTEADSGNQARWIPYKYAGETHSGIILIASPAFINGDSITIGQYSTVKLKTWTTELGNNTPYMKLKSGYSNMASASWNYDNFSLGLATMSVGELKINPIIRTDGTTTAFRTYVKTLNIVPNIDGKTGFLQNVATEKYMEVEGPSTNDGAFIQQGDFSEQAKSKWLFELQDDGYFTIKSQYSNMYVGVDSAATTVIRQYSTTSDYTLWKFIETTSGNYKLVCKATEASGNVLATSSATSINGSNLTMTPYTDDDNYRDEWNPQRNVVFKNMTMNLGEKEFADIINLVSSSNATAADFTYSLACSHVASVVKINSTTKEITANKQGVVLVKATSSTYGTYLFKINVIKRAIIIIPGIMGSELISIEDNSDFKWDKSIMDGSLSNAEIIDHLLYMRCNNVGESEHNIAPYNDDNYGFADTYEDLYIHLQNTHKNEYDVYFFAYDWRLSNQLSGQKLDDFIQDNNIEKCVLVCHSMGGLVASSYLTMGEDQRNKVETMISLGTPYLGSPVMPYVWGKEDIEVLGIDLEDKVENFINFLSPTFNPVDFFIQNYRSLYELFPTRRYFDTNFADKYYIVSSDNLISLMTFEHTDEVVKNRLPKLDSQLLSNADAFHDSLFINGEHVTSLINTYYIAGFNDGGINFETIETFVLESPTYEIKSYTEYGDKTVPTWSADLANKYPDKTFYAKDTTHTALVTQTKVLRFISKLIKGDTSIEGDCITATCPWQGE